MIKTQKGLLKVLLLLMIVIGGTSVPGIASASTKSYSPINPFKLDNPQHITYRFQNGTKANKRIFQKAVKKWNGTKLVHFEQVKTKATIVVRWQNKSAKETTNATGATKIWTRGNMIDHEVISLYTQAAKDWHLSAEGKYLNDAHELGHALGLKHDKNRHSVMNQFFIDGKYDYYITTQNLNAVKQIYHE
ncbi:matrixin family metalloprotease [Periweissella cryptocerci]|uniref:Matrixin family metalloprotease n=1 Tax=Periweissella cryptocerci TaxID=2506420 RepID=A0A4V1AIB9_9LACO|nr:matrixin family metalloprotease [Periweissella cryptocerci]QBO34965.1 matrixin family metalloprotease [Periweissella cryptocerci]